MGNSWSAIRCKFHPHSNGKKTISVVHNGIIENYIDIKEWLMSEGYKFKSETDTEVLPQFNRLLLRRRFD